MSGFPACKPFDKSNTGITAHGCSQATASILPSSKTDLGLLRPSRAVYPHPSPEFAVPSEWSHACKVREVMQFIA